MLFDTDVLIWAQRKNPKAFEVIGDAERHFISVQTYMELLQGARNQADMRIIKSFLSEVDFETLPLTENIGHRALIYIEEYALSSGLRSADALIAATALENGLALVTSNQKHFKPIKELKLFP
ncbi:MAG TPA: type II toxin-antitoxin system VapC family toxin, partial [Candidatus Omnitrophota bacterium]|nr:type II toxin-antitoxin system VapC family toxin [Candidatus Omnitrophota bacterium]